jgi:hypothetical protein
MFKLSSRGDFEKTRSFLQSAKSKSYLADLDTFGQMGVSALSAATPHLTGETASSWSYVIQKTPGWTSISWINTNDAGTAPLAVMLQYGHGTRNGGYVQGRDFINPAIRPVFDSIASAAWASLIRK